MMIRVLKLPPRLSYKTRVSFESLYETCSLPLASCDITLPNEVRDKLIYLVSSARESSRMIFDNFSLPARSTRLSHARFSLSFGNFYTSSSMKRVCAHEEQAFIRVSQMCLAWFPTWNTSNISLIDVTGTVVQPSM